MIKTGYYILDRLTGGFHKGELISIIGRPLMGRTIFVLNLYRNLIFEGRNKAAFLTSECPIYKAIELLTRMMDNEHSNVADSIIDVSNCPNIDMLNDTIRRLVYKDGINVIILDSLHYLTLFDDVNSPSLYEKLADATRRIKQLAKELGITIIMTSRTNYMVDEREGFQGLLPQLSDTDKMGDLAYYSDVVLGLYRPEVDAVLRDIKGNDLHDILFVLVLKSRKVITGKYPTYSISPKNCSITEKRLVANRDAILEEFKDDTDGLSDALINKGKELWAFLSEVNVNLNVCDMEKNDQPLFDGVMNILDLVQISKECKYNFSIIHEAFTGYFTTICLQGENLKQREANNDDISIGLEVKNGVAINSMVIWQIYLFCKFYRGIDYAEWYYGKPIFEVSDIDPDKVMVAHEEDREHLKQIYSRLHVEKSSLLPQVIFDGSNYHVKCTWWFPSKGLVQETIDYSCCACKVSESNSNQQVL